MFNRGYKFLRGKGRLDIPGIEDFFGLDLETGKIFHIHAHYQLVVGHDSVKNIRLPVEDCYIQSSTFKNGSVLPTPAIEMEFIVFVIRMCLKFTILGYIIGNRELKGSALNEFKDLKGAVNNEHLDITLKEKFPFIDKRRFNICLDSLKEKKSILLKYQAYTKIKKDLYCMNRYSRLYEILMRLRLRLTMFSHRMSTERVVLSGGSLVAIIGGDGSGKSTLIRSLSEWIDPYFFTKKMHFGKPKRRISSRTFNLFLKFFYILGMEKLKEGDNGCFTMLNNVLYTRDRFYAYKKMINLSTNGAIVLSDRYNLSGLKTMDGSSFDVKGGHENSLLTSFFSNIEKYYLSKIVGPELAIYLEVDVEEAVKRKTDEESHYVRIRNTEIKGSKWVKSFAVTIDANQSAECVLKESKLLLWNQI